MVKSYKHEKKCYCTDGEMILAQKHRTTGRNAKRYGVF